MHEVKSIDRRKANDIGARMHVPEVRTMSDICLTDKMGTRNPKQPEVVRLIPWRLSVQSQ
jgi:hypothetical protein